MLAVGIFAPHGTDHDRNIAFCHDTDVHHIVLGAGGIAGKDSDGVPSTNALKDLVDKYAAEGITLAALTPDRIRQAAFSDPDVQKEEVATFGRLIQNMGEAGIPYVHLYLNVDRLSSDDEREGLWDGLVEVYNQITRIAETAGVRISTHHFHVPDRILWNYETMSRLLSEVNSPANGVTFCQGKSQMAGDDLARDILNYGDQIFMFHIRDVVTQVEGDISPEVEKRLADIGYLEVAFGTGEVDMVGSIRALKQINYQGQIYPEHYPSIAGDSAAGLAWTIGYIRALDEAVET